MSSVRKTISLLESGSRLVYLRRFHASPPVKARPAPRKSPRITSSTKQQSVIRVRKSYSIEESLPTISLLNSAKESGVLTVEQDHAIAFLRRYHELAERPIAGWEQKICTGEQSAS